MEVTAEWEDLSFIVSETCQALSLHQHESLGERGPAKIPDHVTMAVGGQGVTEGHHLELEGVLAYLDLWNQGWIGNCQQALSLYPLS